MIQMYPLRIFEMVDQQIYDVINSKPAYSDQAFLFGKITTIIKPFGQYVLKHSPIPILI